MKVITNTYPVHAKVAHAEPGDECHWELIAGCYRLVRESDGKTLFSTGQVNKDENLYSTGLPPVLIGIIAQVKSKNWILKIN